MTPVVFQILARNPDGRGKYCSATGCMSGTIWADFLRYVIYLFCFPRGVQVTKYSEDWTLKIEIQNLLWSLSISYPSSRRAVEIISRFSSLRCLHDFRWLLCSTQMMSVDLAACLRLRRRLSLAAVRRAAETLDTTVSFTVKAVTSVHPLELTSFLPMNSELPSSWELNHQYICRLQTFWIGRWRTTPRPCNCSLPWQTQKLAGGLSLKTSWPDALCKGLNCQTQSLLLLPCKLCVAARFCSCCLLVRACQLVG